MNVSAVLTAGFIHSGEHFRVTAQLIDVASGELLWSDRIDTSAADIIAVQDTIAQRIVGRIIRLSPAEQVGIAKRRETVAYEQYLRPRFVCAFHPHCCRATIATAPSNISTARSARSELQPFDGSAPYIAASSKDLRRNLRARDRFQKSTIDPNIVEARMLMVFVYLWRGEKQKARDEVNRARNEAPNEPVVHF